MVDYSETREDLNFNFKDQQTIDIVPLDGFICQNNLPIPTFLKIDIDGSEIPFLEGASETLSSTKLKSVLFELSTADLHYEQILRRMEESGLVEAQRFQIPNEPNLYNIQFDRK